VVFCDEATLLKLVSKKNYGLYEVITSFPHKVYFDVDRHAKEDESYLAKIKKHICEYFPDAEMSVSGSYTNTKTSFHFVLQNYLITNEKERQHVKSLVMFMKQHKDDEFDWKVYTINRNMKCINQSKKDGRVQTELEGEKMENHLITCFLPTNSLPFSDTPEPVKEVAFIEKSKGTFDVGALPAQTLEVPADLDPTKTTPEELLALLPLSNDGNYDHRYTHLVARFCYHSGVSREL
jgi:hypothetical protein